MNRRSPLCIFAATLGITALLSCADTGPQVPDYFTRPMLVNGNKSFTYLALGDFHSCGLLADGEAFCWGLNAGGQSGNGVASDVGVNTPIAVIGNFRFGSITAGGNHSCGILLDGTTMCWGNNVGGQLGVGSVQDKFEPTPVVDQHHFIQVSASTISHTCAVEDNGEAWCWGSGEFGRLGNGTVTQQNSPVLVSGGISFISISTGGGHTCGISVDGSAYCWGFNFRGELGDGTTEDRLVPTKVATTIKFKQIASGLSHTCALSEIGDPYCWGDNTFGSLGDGTTVSKSVPTPVSGALNFESIVVGERHACGLDVDGNVHCWGYNELGSLGDGTTLTRPTPVALDTTIAFSKIAAGAYHTCGIALTGQTFCWGSNYAFQLGVNEPDL
jgi:alpha-tubulin suppressor-like RCC1 family protein